MGLKDTKNEDYDYPSHLYQHDPLQYDYGDYVEGYQNHVKPLRPKTIPERIAKWFGGFKIPSSGRYVSDFKDPWNDMQHFDLDNSFQLKHWDCVHALLHKRMSSKNEKIVWTKYSNF